MNIVSLNDILKQIKKIIWGSQYPKTQQCLSSFCVTNGCNIWEVNELTNLAWSFVEPIFMITFPIKVNIPKTQTYLNVLARLHENSQSDFEDDKIVPIVW